ncbi:MAG TPA: ribonuclease P protein component [Candidatus Eisenbacteria bacterium]|nr:ribonuclease P protein component [Candidatus Eisenbacteria bacterium]
MLPRSRRLTRERDYRAVYDRGRASRSSALVCLALEVGDEPTRVGIVASKKVGDAVRRNRAKRRLREAVRLVWPRLADAGWHVVVIATAETGTLDFGDLVEALRRGLMQTGVLSDAPR